MSDAAAVSASAAAPPAGAVPVSVVMPARGAEEQLRKALTALRACDPQPAEVILVDDASPTLLAGIAAEFGCRYLRREARGGPGAGRNDGVRAATQEIVLFIDSDVVVRKDTVGRVAARMTAPDAPDAVFGSYDDAPGSPRFLAQYKNLVHHFIHQGARRAANTFWGGGGAVKKTSFLAVGGFDVELFDVPSVEDIDLGYRMTDRGMKIELDPELQVCHLKDWRFWDLMKVDILKRAVPWTRLMLMRGTVPPDLNLKTHHRISAALVLLLCLALVLWPFAWGFFFWPIVVLVVALLALNVDLYSFFLQKRGAAFLAKAIPFHWLYYAYAAATFAFTKALWMIGVRGRFGARRAR